MGSSPTPGASRIAPELTCAAMTMVDLPKAVMRSESDCPMVDAGEGIVRE